MQTKEGAIKARDKILSTRPDHYREVGALGGMVKRPTKGFGSDPERARLAGMKGGKLSKRLTEEKKLEIRRLRSSGFSLVAISDRTGISYTTVQRACRVVEK